MAAVTGAVFFLLTLAVGLPAAWGQVNNQPIQPGKYYLDSNAVCNGPVREIYGQTVRVIGHGAIQEQQPPQSCTLTLKSAANFDYTNLLLSVVAGTIRDCDVRLTIYDGDPGQGVLRGYDCNSPNKPNERDILTSGDVVSFTLERRDSVNSLYDIEITVRPLVSGTKPGYENDYGTSWGFFREKLENDAAIGIVGAVFLVTIILVLITVFYCCRRFKGQNKPWEQHQLSGLRPPTSVYDTKSRMSDGSSDVWSSAAPRKPDPARSTRTQANGRMARYSEDDDSVFDDGASEVPPKRYMIEEERRRERERQRERERRRGRGFGAQNSSYVQADDDHPQDTYVERVITPRVRPSRLYKPPSYDDAVNETETEKSDLDDDDEEEEEEEEASAEESEEQSSEAEEDDEEDDEPSPKAKPVARPKAQQPSQPTGAVPLRPGIPTYPGYPMGHMANYPVAPGQFVPIVAAPPGQQFPAVGPGHPPPRYPGDRSQGNVRPTDPPIYSYLVQRGYTPLDAGRESPISQANTSHSQASMDDSDKNVLTSGVEYMRR